MEGGWSAHFLGMWTFTYRLLERVWHQMYSQEFCGEQSELPVVSTNSARGVFEVIGGLYMAKTFSQTKGF